MTRVLVALALWLIVSSAGAATYYADNLIACTGNYNPAARNCTGSSGNSYTTIAAAIAPMVAGDTLYVRVFSGGSGVWNAQIDLATPNKSGTSTNEFIVAGYPSDPAVTFRYTNAAIAGYGTTRARGNRGYITFRHMVWDGVNLGDKTQGIAIRDGNHHFTLDDIEIINHHGTAVGSSGDDITIKNCSFHDNVSATDTAGDRHYGVYHSNGANLLVERTKIYHNSGGGMQLYNDTVDLPLTNAIVRYNQIYENNSMSSSQVGGITVLGSNIYTITGVQIYGNIVYGQGKGQSTDGGGSDGIAVIGSASGTQIHNNVTYNNQRHGIHVSGAGTTGTDIRNNITITNDTSDYNVGGSGTTSTNNACPAGACGTSSLAISSILNCAPSTSDFTQKPGSSCIDQGVSVGRLYNGSAPDIGAFETFILSSCQVPNGLASTIQASFSSNAYLLGSTLTTFTARKNGASNALTGAATKIGDTIVSLPLTNSYAGGDSADISWSSGGLTDNALIGGTLNQPYIETLTNRSCTNNAGGAPSYVLNQARYQFRGVRGAETTTDIRLVDNVDEYETIKGGAARIRLVVTCANVNCPPTAFSLRYSLNGGAYTVIPDSYGADNIGMCGTHMTNIGVENATPTTDQISAISGTFIPGAVILLSNAIPTITGLNVGFKTEMEYCVSFDTDASGGYLFRLYEQNGSIFNGSYLTPFINIVDPRSPAGF